MQNHTSRDYRIAMIAQHIPAGSTPWSATERFLLLGQEVTRDEYFAWMNTEIAALARRDAERDREWRRDGWRALGALVTGAVVLLANSYFWYAVVQHLINH